MKIIPVTERWNEGERDWSFVKNPKAAIEDWENREGLSLPEPYRRFMLRYNGGRVYPRLFHTEAALFGMLGPYVPTSDITYVASILSWTSVESHWRGETYGGGVPPRHLVFAETPGSIQLLMALTPEKHGHIFAWIHSTDIWGTDRNTQLFPQANSFTEFLDSLFDDEDGRELVRWSRLYDKLAKDLEL